MKGKEYEEKYVKEKNWGKGGIGKKGAIRRSMYSNKCTYCIYSEVKNRS
jgi:hypothetical protein